MHATNIQLSDHARMQMQRRRVTLEDIALVLLFGDHGDGTEVGTGEACTELDGRPLTCVYDSAQHRLKEKFYVITILRR